MGLHYNLILLTSTPALQYNPSMPLPGVLLNTQQPSPTSQPPSDSASDAPRPVNTTFHSEPSSWLCSVSPDASLLSSLPIYTCTCTHPVFMFIYLSQFLILLNKVQSSNRFLIIGTLFGVHQGHPHMNLLHMRVHNLNQCITQINFHFTRTFRIQAIPNSQLS